MAFGSLLGKMMVQSQVYIPKVPFALIEITGQKMGY